MSLTVELALARCAALLGERVVCLSDHGVGSPLLSGLGTVERMALRPLGGISLEPVSRYAPPAHLMRHQLDAARILSGTRVIMDGTADTIGLLRRNLRRYQDEEPEIIRTRGEVEDSLPGMTCVISDQSSGDAIWLRSDLLDGAIPQQAAYRPGDEFDDLSRQISSMGATTGIVKIRYSSGGGEMVIAPPTALDMPDTRQLDAALGERRAVFDIAGSCALVFPHLSNVPAPFGFSVSGLPADAPDPAVLSLPTGCRVETDRVGAVWRAIVTPDVVGEATAVELALPVEYSAAGVEVINVWTGMRRSRADWEAWDEAEAQLDMEQSW